MTPSMRSVPSRSGTLHAGASAPSVVTRCIGGVVLVSALSGRNARTRPRAGSRSAQR
jgi:hypothetical protein